MAHFFCFSNAQQSRQRRDEMPIFSRKGVNCEGAPALTFSYLHIHTIYITLTVRRMVRKPSQKNCPENWPNYCNFLSKN